MFEIEKDVPFTGPARQKGNIKYPWPQMEVGDSIFVEGGTLPGTVYAAAMGWAKANGRLFKGKRVDGGVRIWRLE